ncbi:MAG: UDP-galactopyranose mutase [Betaproteobacteria bacterium]
MEQLDVLVVGMGFAGATVARVVADVGLRVHLVDRRPHIGGNAFDEFDAAGVRVHRYGPHIFHTNSDRILAFLSRFTEWVPYELRVLARVDGQLLPVPINRTTINRLYGLDLDEAGVAAFLERVRLPRDPIVTSEDVVLGSVGADLCDRFFRGYTRKQWGLDLAQLAAGVAARIPVRSGDDDRYFTDRHQCMPAAGYAALFARMLDHPRISTATDAEFDTVRGTLGERHLVYTGPIDAYFDHRYGRLPYRSLEFRHEHLPATPRFQPAAVVNFPGDEPFTRIVEFKHLTGQAHAGTSILREYPRADGEPFYPIPRPESEAQYKRYEALAATCDDVTFVGRLAQYRYYNMDQVVGAALAAAARIVERLGAR